MKQPVLGQSRDRALDEKGVPADPLQLFDLWYNESLAADLPLPNAMVLSTVSQDGRPSGRVVLLKDYGERGFVFFTNYESRKGEDLEVRPYASLVFYWPELERQVRIEGKVTKVSSEESDAYFQTRPRESQIGARASAQSRTIANREELEHLARVAVERYKDKPIPRPQNWGGYCVHHESVEFWQGRIGRLHDRILFTRRGQGWTISRLQP